MTKVWRVQFGSNMILAETKDVALGAVKSYLAASESDEYWRTQSLIIECVSHNVTSPNIDVSETQMRCLKYEWYLASEHLMYCPLCGATQVIL